MKKHEDSSIPQLIEAISEIAERASPDDARSALLYCLKQLKISAAHNEAF